MNHRATIAERLSFELNKQDLTLDDVARKSDLSVEKIRDYFSANTEMKINELQKICFAINLNFYLLISNDYKPSNILYRNVTPSVKHFAKNIENTFHIIKDFLPTCPVHRTDPIQLIDNHREIIIASIIPAIQKIQNKYPTHDVEWLYDLFGITVFPVSTPFEFDAFFLSSEDKFAVCVNLNQAPCRILFSLLHELSHFLFDRNKSLNIDIDCASNPFNETIDDTYIHEFIATKFAQYYLIPFGLAQKWAITWDSDTYDAEIQNTLLNSGASVDVLVNCIYDILKIRGSKTLYSDIKARYSSLSSGNPYKIKAYLEKKITDVKGRLNNNRAFFSEEVFKQITKDLTIG